MNLIIAIAQVHVYHYLIPPSDELIQAIHSDIEIATQELDLAGAQSHFGKFKEFVGAHTRTC